MDELQGKRDEKYRKKNKHTLLDMLYFVAHKDEIRAMQETFKVDNIKAFRRMEELFSEMYSDSTLILQTYPGTEENNSSYLTVLNVVDRKNLPYVVNELVVDQIGENYTLTEELLVWPSSLSFSNGGEKLCLMSYDVGTIEVWIQDERDVLSH